MRKSMIYIYIYIYNNDVSNVVNKDMMKHDK